MDQNDLEQVVEELRALRATRCVGRVTSVLQDYVRVSGFDHAAKLGDQVGISTSDHPDIHGEIIALSEGQATVLPSTKPDGIAMGDKVVLLGKQKIFPHDSWLGRVIDPNGQALDGQWLAKGAVGLPLMRQAPSAVFREGLGPRLNTGLVVLNTLLPIARGQRVGLFAGSGVGKTTLLGHLASHMEADVVVVALIGERGREVRDFIQKTLGPEGMKRTIIVAATSDQSPLMRRQCAFTAMSVAEHFRDAGRSVLYLADSITRLAEAHREVATAAGEMPALRGFPASMVPMITSLCERAGPGAEGQGDITGIFSVLVAASDMDEPVADTLRGVLDGHFILDRQIAERGRFPALDVVRSVSRSLPDIATDAENVQITKAQKLLAAYARSETMIRAGLYVEGSDPVLDQAVRVFDDFETLLARREPGDVSASFQALANILRAADAYTHAARKPARQTSDRQRLA